MTEKDCYKYVLAPDVFYRKTPAGDVVLYQTTKQNVFLLGGQVYDLLDALKENRYASQIGGEPLAAYWHTHNSAVDTEMVSQMLEMGWIAAPTILEERKHTLEGELKMGQYRPVNALSDVQFELTFRCNEHCRHCYCPRENEIAKELTTAEVKGVLDELKEMQVMCVTFTGGDLFMRTDAFEIMEYAYRLGFVINIFTNGTLLKDADFFRLKALYPRSVHFSIYNYIPEKHDAFTQLPGSFERTVSAIKKCRMLGIPTNIKVSLVEENYDDIEGICELAEDLGTTIQISMQITPKNDGGMEPTALRINNAVRYAEVMRKVDRHILLVCAGETLNDSDKLENGPVCGTGVYSLNINPYGDVFACNALLIPCGNIRSSSIQQIWEGSEELKRIRSFRMNQLKGCEGCAMKRQCDFCPGSAMQETGDPLMRYSEACTLAKAKIIKQKGDSV